ncbi:P-selectin glycoprotein ligand 1 [Pteropus alecto]|uniref:p-selectin glycoprotein ligand 1 n=1 Tax=Pteropus alecto TaxID=9402 RepID=L5JWV9_PTEAL|nr:P-selectin glycoprotein ligand 1 [Pteropus alecto]ELK03909.1 P-selectin glycoprotein ligand 1 [Pteropus alecto]
MPLQLLLLLTLLGPGSSLPPWETWKGGAKEAPGPLLARGRRQVATEDLDPNYDYGGTDPPEMLEHSTWTVLLSLKQRDSSGPSTPEPATLEGTTGHSARLDTEGAAIGNLSTESATQGIPVTLGPLTKELVTTIPPIMEAPSTEAPSTELATIKDLSTGPPAMEALTTQPAATEALTTQPAATEALTTQPAATEALTTQPAATEALTTQPTATEALTMKSTVMEAPSMGPAVIETLSTEPAATADPTTEPTATEAMSTDPATTKDPSIQPATTRDLTTALLVPSDPHRGTTVSASNSSNGFIYQRKNSQGLSPQSSVAPSPTGSLDYIPVKQCLLAILILALVATIFLVCTVVLAVRLSRKNHMYPVRNYSPTEMVCISSLLPEGSEGPTATANGSLPTKGQGLKVGPGKDREGDDLTLHSFLP